MNREHITLSNRITAASSPQKHERLRVILHNFVQQVHEREPGTLAFYIYDAPDQSCFLTFEIYESQEAIQQHLQSSYFKELIEIEEVEGLKGGKNNILKPLDVVYKFSRSQVNFL